MIIVTTDVFIDYNMIRRKKHRKKHTWYLSNEIVVYGLYIVYPELFENVNDQNSP